MPIPLPALDVNNAAQNVRPYSAGVEIPNVAGNFMAGADQADKQQTARLSSLIQQYTFKKAQDADAQQTTLRNFYSNNGANLVSNDPTTRQGALSGLAGIDPNEAIGIQGKLATQDETQARTAQVNAQTAQTSATTAKAQFELAHQKLDFIGAQAQSILSAPPEYRPMLYARAKAQARAMGIDESNAPDEYSDAAIQQMANQAMSGKDQLDQHWKQMDEARQTAIQAETVRHNKADEANAQARNTETARANQAKEADAPGGIEPSTIDPDSQSILAQTGLSMPAFMALTGKSSQLPRDKATRTAALNEATKFANKSGTDVSTLASQYEANNKTLESNIARVNSTRIMEGELDGTIANLKPVADAVGAGKLRLANVAKVWAGQETNDPIAQQYSFQLNQLRSELAAYNGALQGRAGASLNEQDYAESERVIKSGLSSGSADGLQKAVAAATQKMSGVLNRNVDVARKSVWDLFGVGDKYKPKFNPDGTPATAKASTLPDEARAKLKEGTVTTFGNGQKWTLQNGQPVQVP